MFLGVLKIKEYLLSTCAQFSLVMFLKPEVSAVYEELLDSRTGVFDETWSQIPVRRLIEPAQGGLCRREKFPHGSKEVYSSLANRKLLGRGIMFMY